MRIKACFRHALLASLALNLFSAASRAQFLLDEETPESFNLAPTDISGIDDAKLSPDGRWIVARDNTGLARARVYDYDTGSLATIVSATAPLGVTGPCQDAVALTAERGVVLGTRTMVLDLTTSPPSLLVDHDTGERPRDLVITPDGDFVCIRGGSTRSHASASQLGPFTGGLFVFELTGGSLVAHAPGEPPRWYASSEASFDVDSVVATDEFAAFTSAVGSLNAPRTRVTVMELRPASGGPPQVVFQTDVATDQTGSPHDIALFEDGQHFAVRSETAVALYQFAGAQTAQVWSKSLFGDPGPFGGSALDSIEVRHDCVATISRWSNGFYAAQLDLFDLAGNQRWARLAGDPHDLVLTPDGTQLFVRTSSRVYGYDLATLGAGPEIQATDSKLHTSTHTSFGAGLDSIVATDTKVVTLARTDLTTDVRIWEVAGGDLTLAAAYVLPDKACDVDLSPDGTLAAASGLSYIQVYDLRTNRLIYEHDPTTNGGVYPWCEGLALDDERLVAFGYYNWDSFEFGGWLSVIDLFADATVYCTANPNSTGASATIDAVGSPSLAANDLHLVAANLPAQLPGMFFYGNQQQQVPFGNGSLCVSGAASFATISTGSGAIDFAVDNQALPGPALTVGTTWNFQFAFRDPQAGGAGYDLTPGLAIDIEP